MGYFDGLVDGSFATAQDGALLFYPEGIYGKVYIIPNQRRKQEIRASLKRHTIMGLVTTIGSAGIILSLMQSFSIPIWLAGAVYLAIGLGLSFTANAMIRELTDGLTQTEHKISVAEIYRNSARSHDWPTLWGLALVSLFFTLGGAILSMDGTAIWYVRFAGILGALFFGVCTAALAYMLKVKKQS